MVSKSVSDVKRDMLTPRSLSGHISHSEIIGRNERDIVKSNRGADLRAYLPTLAEYVTLTPRIVTPVSPLCSLPCTQSLITPPKDLPRRRQSYSIAARYPCQSRTLISWAPVVRDSRSRHRARRVDIVPCQSYTCCKCPTIQSRQLR